MFRIGAGKLENFAFFRILSTIYYLMVIGYTGRSVNLNRHVTTLVPRRNRHPLVPYTAHSDIY
jgi:hypothetical protein